ncbi:MAG: hypothetical protein HYV00_04740 [Deltaproteobacteria bacterium]|nr:hypothetical protein [Deltaproteobacteria bacterium]
MLRPRLIAASLFIAGFESLKESIVGHIRDFFCQGFDEKGDIINPKYQAEVLSRNRSPVYASLAWLKDISAIDDTDIAAFERVKVCRNHVAHRLLELVENEGMPPDFADRFQEMAALLRKIEVWWIREVDIPTNPDFDGREIDEAVIIPGPVIGLQLLCDIALGSEERSRFYYEEMRKRSGQRGA